MRSLTPQIGAYPAQAYIASAYINDGAMNRAMDLLIEAAGDLAQQAKIDNEHNPRRGYRAPRKRDTSDHRTKPRKPGAGRKPNPCCPTCGRRLPNSAVVKPASSED